MGAKSIYTAKAKRKRPKDEEGNTVVRFSYGDTIHPKLEEENNSQYLHRLYVLEEEKMEKQFAKMSKNLTQFSTGLQDSIKTTLQMGNSLARMMESFRQPVAPDISKLASEARRVPVVTESSSASVDIDALVQDAQEARWAPFNAVNKRLDTLVKLSGFVG